MDKIIVNNENKYLTLFGHNDIQIGIEQLKPFSTIVANIEKEPFAFSIEVRSSMVLKENYCASVCKTCPLLKKAPYVCNSCPKKRKKCGFTKQFFYIK